MLHFWSANILTPQVPPPPAPMHPPEKPNPQPGEPLIQPGEPPYPPPPYDPTQPEPPIPQPVTVPTQPTLPESSDVAVRRKFLLRSLYLRAYCSNAGHPTAGRQNEIAR